MDMYSYREIKSEPFLIVTTHEMETNTMYPSMTLRYKSS